MSSEVKVEEKALRGLESALGKFQKEAQETLTAVQDEVSRTQGWLRGRRDYWEREREQARGAVDQARRDVRRAEAALSACLAWRDDEGRGRSCSSEEAALRATRRELRQAENRLRTAEAELQNVKQWMARVEQAVGEYDQYAGRMTELMGSRVGEGRVFLIGKMVKLREYRDRVRSESGQVVSRLVESRHKDLPARTHESRTAASLLDDESFEAELRRRFPNKPINSIDEIDGFYDERDGRAFAREGRQYLLAPVHERLHQISHPKGDALPRSLTEGMTEWYARRDLGPYSQLHRISQDSSGNVVIEGPSAYYDEEVRIVSMLTGLVGERLIGGAYFHGRVDDLRVAVDAELGPGKFGRILSLMKGGRCGEAEALILKHFRAR
jgi:hypothetical protein